jgi:integrase
VLRQYRNKKYHVTTLGIADDVAGGLTFAEAEALARTATAAAVVPTRLTVRQAMARFIDHKEALGQSVSDTQCRNALQILPTLGNCLVSELTAEQLRQWLAALAAAPARRKPPPNTDEAIRARRASANRVLAILKAALNHAFDEGLVASNLEWDRKLKPFHSVNVARAHWLDHAQARSLINAAAGNFKPLVRAALETGCRYSELTRLVVGDFNQAAGTLTIRRSKSGKSRHVILTAEGCEFFRAHCVGERHDRMFPRADGCPWGKSEQARPMRAACRRAGIVPAVSFHALRHTWASLSIMAGMPLLVVARNLGHSDTRMVERHYGHLAANYITEAIRAAAPRYGLKASVVPFAA